MVKCCLFDLDGTLLSTLPTIAHYVNKTLEYDGLAPITLEECRQFIGDGPRMLITRAYKAKGRFEEGLLEQRLSRYKSEYAKNPYYLTESFPGVEDCLKGLREMGIILCVLSNKQDSAVAEVSEKFFPGIFTIKRGSIDGFPLKPSPELALNMISELGVTPGEVVFVGDTDVDMMTGKAMGAKSVGVSWGYRSASDMQRGGADAIAYDAQMLFRLIVGDE